MDNENIMRTRNIYILLTCLAAVFSCAQLEEDNIIEDAGAEKVQMTFAATICDEGDPESKTVLGGEISDKFRDVLWSPGDEIGVVGLSDAWAMTAMEKFNSKVDSPSKATEFDGGIEVKPMYFAIYPYEGSAPSNYVSCSMQFTIPENQNYVSGSFDKNVAPMAARARNGEELHFRNLAGLLRLQLTGEECVKSITFRGKDASGNFSYVSGNYVIDMVKDPYAEEITITDETQWTYNHTDGGIVRNSKSVTLKCEEPVQLSNSEPTSFYFVLPPADYHGFIVTITTADGQVMMKENKNVLSIRRAHTKPAANLEYCETVSIDLSAKGTANSYIVPESGMYSFDASVIGNGEFGLNERIMEGAYAGISVFHTTDPDINPVSAEILWNDKRGPIADLTFDKENKRVNFVATGNEGNALIAVKDADGTILWSWHIWCTDQPVEHNYVNSYGNFVVLDRNLGATCSYRPAENKDLDDTWGLLYQWGRKDPFLVEVETDGLDSYGWTYLYTFLSTNFTLQESIEMPSTFAMSDTWNKDSRPMLWSTSSKTVYDPCPVGYRVATSDVFRGFTTDGNRVDRGANINYSGSYDKGFNLIYDGSQTAWYPAHRYNPHHNSGIYYEDRSCYIWTANDHYAFRYYYNSNLECYLDPAEWNNTGHGFAVRCMKDETTAKILLNVNEISDITSSSVSLSGRISVYGTSELASCGFVVGTSSDVTIADGTVYTCEDGPGDISCQITDLNDLTRYYVKAFVTLKDGTTCYSAVKAFATFDADGESSQLLEPSNSFIVNPGGGAYAFELLKGNRSQSVEGATSAKVLWETTNNIEATVPGTLISSVILEDNHVKFALMNDVVPGNALVAVTDAHDNILWSWHIWITDTPQEHTFTNSVGNFTIMDRNLGATSATLSQDAMGLFYQWGRKDPFRFDDLDRSLSTVYDVQVAIQNPTKYIAGDYWLEPHDNTLWSRTKTVYDPCPAGWVVAGSEVWNDAYRIHDQDGQLGGITLVYSNNPNTYVEAWYQDTPRTDAGGNWDGGPGDDSTEFWTVNERVTQFINYNEHYTQDRSACDLYPVRCVKEY